MNTPVVALDITA